MGELERVVGVLFDDQDGQAVLPVQGPDGVENLPGRSGAQVPATARLASTARGRLISARPIASICCSPPLSARQST